MRLKALLLCSDVRLEVGGTLTAVGVFNERLVVQAGAGAVHLPQLTLLVVVAGLRGVERIAYRHQLRRSGAEEVALTPAQSEPHQRESDEHNFVIRYGPITFAGAGPYEVAFEVEAGEQSAVHRSPFFLDVLPIPAP